VPVVRQAGGSVRAAAVPGAAGREVVTVSDHDAAGLEDLAGLITFRVAASL
jgi:hypothetical protein